MLERSGSIVNFFRIIDDLVDLTFGMNGPLDLVFTNIDGSVCKRSRAVLLTDRISPSTI